VREPLPAPAEGGERRCPAHVGVAVSSALAST
jgi:hypothetical protein